jgi:uncharacterized heparinase superfamily protein
VLKPALYFHTIRHLRPKQVSSRLLRKLNAQTKGLSAPTSFTLRQLTVSTSWVGKPSKCEDGFNFINLRRDFPAGGIDWLCPEMPKLWRYNLHYFDYLLDAGRPKVERCQLIDDWIAGNPVGAPDAWEPFPVSLRIVNWIKFLFGEGRGQTKPEWLKSLYQQALWLERNIEYHLLANHLFKNAKALVCAGLFFEGTDADRWRLKGLELLCREIAEQVLPDGGHFERSPMYHSMIMEDCLDLINICLADGSLAAQALADKLPPTCRKMMAFLLGMAHPDGQIALFNDAAFGIEASPTDLAEYYERVIGETPPAPGGSSWAFPDTGYFVMAPQPDDRLVVDCGPIGPDYQPGHSHCDTLSFELSLKGRRVIVDSGCCQYEDGDIRKYNRGNVGHNTVAVDGENQSEVWGAHRCARRAYPLYARLNERGDGSIFFEGAHGGYKRLRGKPIHQRSITWAKNQITIEDRIEGQGTHDIESRLHIHPDLKVEAADNGARVTDNGQTLMTVSAEGQGRVEIESGWYCPEFNIKHKCPVLTIKLRRIILPLRFGWHLQLNENQKG